MPKLKEIPETKQKKSGKYFHGTVHAISGMVTLKYVKTYKIRGVFVNE